MSDNYKTTGEFIVRTNFSVADDPATKSQVDYFKQKYAALVNEVEALTEKEDWSPRQKSSFARLKARVYTLLEDASGLTVKAVTV